MGRLETRSALAHTMEFEALLQLEEGADAEALGAAVRSTLPPGPTVQASSLDDQEEEEEDAKLARLWGFARRRAGGALGGEGRGSGPLMATPPRPPGDRPGAARRRRGGGGGGRESKATKTKKKVLATEQAPDDLLEERGEALRVVEMEAGLVLDAALPPGVRGCMPFARLNEMQSATFASAFSSPDNVVVTAPTGSGKTEVFTLAVLRAVDEAQRRQEGPMRGKALYLAPLRALCEERARDWGASTRLGRVSLRVCCATGDAPTQRRVLEVSDVVCTTPEWLDAWTRGNPTEAMAFASQVQLLLLDEIHVLQEPRGAVLEGIVSRMLAASRDPRSRRLLRPIADLRIVAASATLPNLEDVARWVHAPPEHTYSFGPMFRPVELTLHVIGFPDRDNKFLFHRALDYRVMDMVRRFAAGRPSLVFCPTRKSTSQVAMVIAQQLQGVAPEHLDGASDGGGAGARRRHGRALGDEGGVDGLADTPDARAALERAAAQCGDPDLRRVLPLGLAFHHAGLSVADRHLVEELFRARHVMVLCATTTLAVGVNLPAHLVVIKGTSTWRGAEQGYQEMSPTALAQMTGRAGRAGMDEHGIAVIMTERSRCHHYESLLSGGATVESALALQVHELVCTEAMLGTITTLEETERWLAGTFFAVRAARNPALLDAILAPSTTGSSSPEHHPPVAAAAFRVLSDLLEADCLTILPAAHDGSDRDGPSHSSLLSPSTSTSSASSPPSTADEQLRNKAVFQCTVIGRVLASNNLRFHTLRVILNFLRSPPTSHADASADRRKSILLLVSGCEELLEDATLRRADKAPLNELSGAATAAAAASPLPFPIRDRVRTAADKAFVLLQAHVSRLKLGTRTALLASDEHRFVAKAPRILSSVAELAMTPGVMSPLALDAILLRKCIASRVWGTSAADDVRQLASLPNFPLQDAALQRLVRANVQTVEDLMRAQDHELATLLGLSAPRAQAVVANAKARLRALPRLCIAKAMIDSRLQLRLTLQPPNAWREPVSLFHHRHTRPLLPHPKPSSLAPGAPADRDLAGSATSSSAPPSPASSCFVLLVQHASSSRLLHAQRCVQEDLEVGDEKGDGRGRGGMRLGEASGGGGWDLQELGLCLQDPGRRRGRHDRRAHGSGHPTACPATCP